MAFEMVQGVGKHTKKSFQKLLEFQSNLDHKAADGEHAKAGEKRNP